MSYLNRSSIQNGTLLFTAAIVFAALFWHRGAPASTPDVAIWWR